MLTILKITEPFVFMEFKKHLRLMSNKICCCCAQKLNRSKEKIDNQPLCGLINKSINIELVSLILLGIGSIIEVSHQ